MTLRECIALQPDAQSKLLVGLDILRSLVQGEPATFEGCCASAVQWLKLYKEITDATIAEWLTELAPILDCEIPDAVLMAIVSADDGDGKEPTP